jgi:hypothetical protein
MTPHVTTVDAWINLPARNSGGFGGALGPPHRDRLTVPEAFPARGRQAIVRSMRSVKHLPLPCVRLVAGLALALAALASSPAAAQTEDELTHLRQLFTEGRQLEGKGQWADALKRFGEVAATKMTPQVRFHMALCEENLGRLVSALRGFDLAANEAKELGSSGLDAMTPALQHAEAVRARIAKLEIDLHGTLTTSRVTLDDVTLAPKDLGVEAPADPGSHVIEVRDASGKSTFHKEVTLAEKGSEKVDVTVDDHDPAPDSGAPAVPSSSSRVPAIVVGAGGVAAIAVSGVFFGLRAANIAAVTRDCSTGDSGCKPADQGLVNQGKTYTTAADALLGVGIAGVVTAGVLWFVLAPKKAPPPSAASSTTAATVMRSLQIVPTGTGLRVLGAF